MVTYISKLTMNSGDSTFKHGDINLWNICVCIYIYIYIYSFSFSFIYVSFYVFITFKKKTLPC
jgi:hypothetical protein